MKRDIKNIIKRIIVGVGIALVLGFLKSHHVFADTLIQNVVLRQFDSYLFPQDQGDYLELYTLSSPYDNLDYRYLLPFTSPFEIYNKGYLIFYNQTEDIYLYMIPRNFNNEDLDVTNMKIVSNNGNIEYQFFNNDLNQYVSSGGYVDTFILSDRNSFDVQNVISNQTPTLVGQNNGNYFYRVGNIPSDFLDDWSLIDSKMSYFNFYNDVLVEDGIPSYYQKVDLTGYQSVYFVPKNFTNVPIEKINYIDYIDFNFYYKGSVKYGFFPLQNENDLFIDNVSVYDSLNNISYVDSFFPLSEDPPDNTGYQYYASILFNQNSPSSIYYDSRYFNHYIIDSLDYYNEDISYIDKDGQNSGANVLFSDRFTDAFDSSFSLGGDNWGPEIGGNTIDSFFSKITYPFDWLKSLLNRNSCSTINLPIPFVDGTIPIECMSSKIKSLLGNFYDILTAIINGFLLYKITILNIDTITDVLDPDDGKLEVIDL